MIVLFLALLFMNGISEYLLNKMMTAMHVLDKKHSTYHAICAVLRIAWIFLGAWFAVPLPVFLIVLLVLLFLNVVPYPDRRLLMNNYTIMVYLLYTSLLMTVIGGMGLLGFDVNTLVQNAVFRGIVMNTTFMIFNALCSLLLHYRPEFLWREDYDKSKVVIYTRFLAVCVIYYILDAVILTLYPTSRINYLLLVIGDILIMILLFNFLDYNYVFAKSEEMKREYEESAVLIAQQYFEKESLKELSGFDALTHAFNRREICSVMAKHIQAGRQLVCVFIDLDGLKRTNDKYGHTFGDLMIKRFADTCMELVMEQGFLARIGGDEFLLVFPDKDSHEIEARIKKLQLRLLEPSDSKEKISFSYGISCGEQSVDSYIRAADQQMYADKSRKQRDNI